MIDETKVLKRRRPYRSFKTAVMGILADGNLHYSRDIARKLDAPLQNIAVILGNLIQTGHARREGRALYRAIKMEGDVFEQMDDGIVHANSIRFPVQIYPVRKFLNQVMRWQAKRANENVGGGKYYCDATLEDLEALWEKQNGRCAISGIPMTTIVGNGYVVPTNISVDRIDSKVGYVASNIRLTCAIANIMRNHLTDHELFIFCKLIFNHNRERYSDAEETASIAKLGWSQG